MSSSLPANLICLSIFAVSLSFLSNVNLYAFIPVLFLALNYKGEIKKVLLSILYLNFFILMVVFSALYNSQNELAITIFIRSNAIIMFALFAFGKSDYFEISYALQALRVPQKLASTFFFTAKFIFLAKEEYCELKKTMLTRNFHVKTTLFAYKIYANMLGILMLKCLDRAEKLQNTMALRDFKGKIYTSNIHLFNPKADIILFLICAISVALMTLI
ncbi:MAG: energy-coupling factor transporter transmembrane component T [Sulfurospirillaceae bacterium]|nr:energy-coupling factor transporter transmembrane component T [Sulfurospirillaceae bacterium]